jgi:ATP-dependent Clp protease ATP-binding subunit ClpA
MLDDRGITLEVTQAAKEVVIAEGYDPAYGARPMRRAIQRLIQDPLSLMLLKGEYQAGETVMVDAEPGGDALRFEKRVPIPVSE